MGEGPDPQHDEMSGARVDKYALHFAFPAAANRDGSRSGGGAVPLNAARPNKFLFPRRMSARIHARRDRAARTVRSRQTKERGTSRPAAAQQVRRRQGRPRLPLAFLAAANRDGSRSGGAAAPLTAARPNKFLLLPDSCLWESDPSVTAQRGRCAPAEQRSAGRPGPQHVQMFKTLMNSDVFPPKRGEKQLLRSPGVLSGDSNGAYYN
jgi:hypothetical protein